MYLLVFLLTLVLLLLLGSFGSYLDRRRENKRVADRIKGNSQQRRSEYVIRPRDALQARETIRRYDPALAMLLDIMIPVEECTHGKEWKKRTGMRDPHDDLWSRAGSICSGCGQKGYSTGGPGNSWLPKDEYNEQSRRFGNIVRAQKEKTEIHDGAGNFLFQLEPPTYEKVWR